MGFTYLGYFSKTHLATLYRMQHYSKFLLKFIWPKQDSTTDADGSSHQFGQIWCRTILFIYLIFLPRKYLFFPNLRASNKVVFQSEAP
jgi:hypothetical protein